MIEAIRQAAIKYGAYNPEQIVRLLQPTLTDAENADEQVRQMSLDQEYCCLFQSHSIGAYNLLNDNYDNLYMVAKKYVTGDLTRLEMISAREILSEAVIEQALISIPRQQLSDQFRLLLLERDVRALQEVLFGN